MASRELLHEELKQPGEEPPAPTLEPAMATATALKCDMCFTIHLFEQIISAQSPVSARVKNIDTIAD